MSGGYGETPTDPSHGSSIPTVPAFISTLEEILESNMDKPAQSASIKSSGNDTSALSAQERLSAWLSAATSAPQNATSSRTSPGSPKISGRGSEAGEQHIAESSPRPRREACALLHCLVTVFLNLRSPSGGHSADDAFSGYHEVSENVRRLACALLKQRLLQLYPRITVELRNYLQSAVLDNLSNPAVFVRNACAELLADLLRSGAIIAWPELIDSFLTVMVCGTGRAEPQQPEPSPAPAITGRGGSAPLGQRSPRVDWELEEALCHTIAFLFQAKGGTSSGGTDNGGHHQPHAECTPTPFLLESASKLLNCAVLGLDDRHVQVRTAACLALRAMLPVAASHIDDTAEIRLIMKPLLLCLHRDPAASVPGTPTAQAGSRLRSVALQTLVSMADLYPVQLSPFLDTIASLTFEILDGPVPAFSVKHDYSMSSLANTARTATTTTNAGEDDQGSSDSDNDSDGAQPRSRADQDMVLVVPALTFWYTLMTALQREAPPTPTSHSPNVNSHSSSLIRPGFSSPKPVALSVSNDGPEWSVGLKWSQVQPPPQAPIPESLRPRGGAASPASSLEDLPLQLRESTGHSSLSASVTDSRERLAASPNVFAGAVSHIHALQPLLHNVIARTKGHSDPHSSSHQTEPLYLAAGACMRACACILGPDICPSLLNFFGASICQPHWLWRESALYFLSSILEEESDSEGNPTERPAKLRKVVSRLPLKKWLQQITQTFATDPSVAVRHAAGWALSLASSIEPYAAMAVFVPVVIQLVPRRVLGRTSSEHMCTTLLHLIDQCAQGGEMGNFAAPLIEALSEGAALCLSLEQSSSTSADEAAHIAICYNNVINALFQRFHPLPVSFYQARLVELLQRVRLAPSDLVRASLTDNLSTLFSVAPSPTLTNEVKLANGTSVLLGNMALELLSDLLRKGLREENPPNSAHNVLCAIGGLLVCTQSQPFPPAYATEIIALQETVLSRPWGPLVMPALNIVVVVADNLGRELMASAPLSRTIRNIFVSVLDAPGYLGPVDLSDVSPVPFARRQSAIALLDNAPAMVIVVLIEAIFSLEQVARHCQSGIDPLLEPLVPQLGRLFNMSIHPSHPCASYTVTLKAQILSTFVTLLQTATPSSLVPIAPVIRDCAMQVLFSPPSRSQEQSFITPQPFGAINKALVGPALSAVALLLPVLHDEIWPRVQDLRDLLIDSISCDDEVLQAHACSALRNIALASQDAPSRHSLLVAVLQTAWNGFDAALNNAVSSQDAACCLTDCAIVLQNHPSFVTIFKVLLVSWIEALPVGPLTSCGAVDNSKILLSLSLSTRLLYETSSSLGKGSFGEAAVNAVPMIVTAFAPALSDVTSIRTSVSDRHTDSTCDTCHLIAPPAESLAKLNAEPLRSVVTKPTGSASGVAAQVPELTQLFHASADLLVKVHSLVGCDAYNIAVSALCDEHVVLLDNLALLG